MTATNMTTATTSSRSPAGRTSSSSVTVVGRLGARVAERILPSGASIWVFTVVVDRRPERGAPPGAARVDAIACQTNRAAVIRRLATLTEGDWVRAEGGLRRRFWRSAGGLGSATEVLVTRLTRE